VSRRIALLAALACAAIAAACTQPAAAAPHMLVGIQDDAQFLYGNPQQTFPYLKTLRDQVVRANLNWGGVHGVARRQPADEMNPDDPAYNWGVYDRLVFYAAQYNIKVLFSIVNTPPWANGHKPTNRAPTKTIFLQRFAYAAAQRYSGDHVDGRGILIPPVRMWMAWNEPNNPAFLFPQWKKVGKKYVVQSARDYAKICASVYAGVHATLLSGEKVACGGTAPGGNNAPRQSRPSVSPLVFLQALKNAGLKKFDVYAHHPYYQHPTETPKTPPKAKTAVTLGNIGTLIKLLTRLYGAKRLWITEYGFQTNPPDKTFGVSYAKQAAYLKQAFAIARKNPRIDLMTWFLLRDEPNSRIGNGWQSGLFTAGWKKKPAFNAFAKLPH
jgi:hypothetical protein